mgnify:CR=1 FL=1
MKNKKIFLVIGNPIKHSLSPFLHNYWFKKNRLNCEYKKLKSQITLTSKKRTEILEIAEKIKQYITNQFISNKSVSLKNLKDKFPSLTSATLCNHIRRAKIILEAKGYKFVKSSAGTYRISKYV